MFRKMEGACEMEGVHAGAGIDHTQFDQSRFCQGRQFQAVTLLDEFIQKGNSLELPPLAKAGLIELGVINARTCVDTFHLTRTFHLSEHLLPYLTQEHDCEPFALNQPSNLRGSLLFTRGLAGCRRERFSGEKLQFRLPRVQKLRGFRWFSCRFWCV